MIYSVSKMQVVSSRQSLWIFTVLFSSLQLWGRLSASTSSPALPVPKLDIYSRSKGSVVLVCRAPEGHQGVQFMLYQVTNKLDTVELQSGADQVHFTVRVQEGDPVQHFCCVYKGQEGQYSAFSPYIRVEPLRDVAPTHSGPSIPPPVLSVRPSTGVVKRGDMLSFSCSVPLQSQSQSRHSSKPVTFLLMRTAEHTGATAVILQPQASQVSSPEPQPGLFSVGPVKGGEEGRYSCLYQITKRRGVVNSTVSNTLTITVADMLPGPSLILQQQTDVWHLLCTGSPSYPGAVFSLYLADNELPVATLQAASIHYQVSFPVPVQDAPLVLYQCQYEVLLGGEWSQSERSLPVALTRDQLGADWPLILGSSSAVVLFLCSVVLLVVMAHRKVKAAVEEKKKRQEAQFWTQVHAKDHVIDLTLRRTSFTSQEWAGVETTDRASRSPLWTSHSTFTTPIHPIH